MKSYAQNSEDMKALKYFGDRKINILSVGENDGKTLSNAKLLIENGAHAWLLEPGKICNDLAKLHADNPNVHVFNYGLGEKEERVTFYESGNHVPGGTDIGLVSSTSYDETVRWRNAGVEFTTTEIQLVPFDKFWEYNGKPQFHMVSLDTEGNDYAILKQIDLNEVGVEFLIIEWNSSEILLRRFTEYCSRFGLKEIHRNAENILFCR